MMKIPFWRSGACILLALSLAACATAPAPASIAATVAATPQLSTVNRLIAEAGLGDALRAQGPFTLFAFKSVPAQTLAELGSNKEWLKSVLNYHLLPVKLPASEVKNSNVKTVNGANLALAQAGTTVTVEDAVVVQADMPASNGVVHVIDRVLLPPKAR
jgi:uncharacterized surface protein with fasciclin (FAS1) repeats